MSFVRYNEGKEYTWNVQLNGNDVDGFQWAICLDSIKDVEEGQYGQVYDVTNRPWRRVGPSFDTRAAGANYLGLGESRRDTGSPGHLDNLIAEYEEMFSSEVETHTRHGQEARRFGRPSQGRTERLQFSATPQLKHWIGQQAAKNESVSQVVFRLLEDLRQRN